MVVAFLLMSSVLAMVIVAILIMTQILNFEQIGSGLLRVLKFLWVTLVVCFLLKVFVLPILLCALVWWRAVILKIFVIVLVVIALVISLRLLLKAIDQKTRCSTQKGE